MLRKIFQLMILTCPSRFWFCWLLLTDSSNFEWILESLSILLTRPTIMLAHAVLAVINFLISWSFTSSSKTIWLEFFDNVLHIFEFLSVELGIISFFLRHQHRVRPCTFFNDSRVKSWELLMLNFVACGY